MKKNVIYINQLYELEGVHFICFIILANKIF